MKTLLIIAAALALLLTAGLFVWRQFDHLSDRREIARLIQHQPTDPPVYDSSLVADLPEVARRYFAFAIAEGTPLYPVAQIDMRGQFSLGDRNTPNYVPMQATQVLASPHGFVWKMAGGRGLMRVSGSDSRGWMRFWVLNLAPVVRAGGSDDHALSAFGRYVSEAVFWTPAAALPGPGITWDALDDTTARVTIAHDGMEQTVDILVDPDGRPTQVVFQRWTNANDDGTFRFQPFGAVLSAFKTVEGFTVPTHVEAGNMFGTDEYYPFFIADVTDITFAGLADR